MRLFFLVSLQPSFNFSFKELWDFLTAQRGHPGPYPGPSSVARVDLLGRTKIAAYPEVLQLFNNEVYPVHISTQKSLIKMEIYKMGAQALQICVWGNHGPLSPLATPMPGSTTAVITLISRNLQMLHSDWLRYSLSICR